MEKYTSIKIVNAKLIMPYRIIPGGALLLYDGRIAQVSEKDIDHPADITIDAEGRYVSPGFIDLHVHGGGGADFMDGTVEAFHKVAKTHAMYGTTSLLPTTLTADKNHLMHTIATYQKAVQTDYDGAGFLGMHIEGPYFDMDQRGAQDPRYIRNPNPSEYKEVIAAAGGCIARWSAAPELPGATDFGTYLTRHGILPAMAHTNAVYDDVVIALEHGYTLATHFYSGMSGVTRRNAFRYAGVIESVYLLDEIDVEIIADGVHLPAPLLRLIHKIKGSNGIALITDAMRAAGMPPGESVLGDINNGLKVLVEDGVAKLPDRSSFAGSVATADRLIRTMITLVGLPLWEAVKMMTLVPARILKLDHQKGLLAAGFDADIILFDEDINISQVIIGGRIVPRSLNA